MFFSEEKNQKTFVPGAADKLRPWPDRGGQRRNKSLLVLFFRKELLSFLILLEGLPWKTTNS
jgi:hypothetical protein